MITVVVEGLDFAGKTTICREVGQRLTAAGTAVTESTTCLSGGAMDRLVDTVYQARRLPSLLRSAVYHAAYVADLFPAAHSGRGKGGVLIQQSYIHRVLAYDRASDRPVLGWIAARLARQLRRQVDLWIYLDCPLDRRQRRYRASGQRDERDEHRFSPGQQPFEERLETELRQLAKRAGYTFIDNTGDDHQDVVDRITALIDQRMVSRRMEART
ncbi:hypothetical protein ACICHK_41690 (plasmid) [Streptomyces sp. AHU1]|uniref:hypothetical protein n=1 Tax=Streptomyces sp. AHU1 TaxID=3377215 RepID=UPI003877AC98